MKKTLTALTVLISGLLIGGSVAGATPASASDIVGDGVDSVKTELLAVAVVVFAAAAIFLAIRKGWSMVRRYVG